LRDTVATTMVGDSQGNGWVVAAYQHPLTHMIIDDTDTIWGLSGSQVLHLRDGLKVGTLKLPVAGKAIAFDRLGLWVLDPEKGLAVLVDRSGRQLFHQATQPAKAMMVDGRGNLWLLQTSGASGNLCKYVRAAP
jgi:hypothetical protein